MTCTHTFGATTRPCEACRTEHFESLMKSKSNCFHMMRLHQQAQQTVSGDQFTLWPPKRTVTSVFHKLAKEYGYTTKQIAAFEEL